MIQWDDSLWLFSIPEFEQLPDGIELTSISGTKVTKGVDYIDQDTRFGYLAFGVRDPHTHPLGELFTAFVLERKR